MVISVLCTPVPSWIHDMYLMSIGSILSEIIFELEDRDHVWASLVAQLVKNPPAMQETWVWSLGWEETPEKGKGYPLQYSGLENSMYCIWSMGSQRVRHGWATFTHNHFWFGVAQFDSIFAQIYSIFLYSFSVYLVIITLKYIFLFSYFYFLSLFVLLWEIFSTF